MEPDVIVSKLGLILGGETSGSPVGTFPGHPSGEPCLARANYFQLREALHRSLGGGQQEFKIWHLALSGPAPLELTPLLHEGSRQQITKEAIHLAVRRHLGQNCL